MPTGAAATRAAHSVRSLTVGNLEQPKSSTKKPAAVVRSKGSSSGLDGQDIGINLISGSFETTLHTRGIGPGDAWAYFLTPQDFSNLHIPDGLFQLKVFDPSDPAIEADR